MYGYFYMIKSIKKTPKLYGNNINDLETRINFLIKNLKNII